jgi:bifunctional UDP-N-acetylglucosamine pyrophosphorylase/glucosamine-1-phosphate N-acetyltransferase
MPVEIVILGAGAGTRMCSKLPKVLHELAGRPLLAHVLDAVREVSPSRIHVVVGYGADDVRAAFSDASDVTWVEQRDQLGTGHAVLQAMPGVDPEASVVALFGDGPLVTADVVSACLDAAGSGMAIVTAQPADPSGLGRIKRGADGAVRAIVEERDASADEVAIGETNTGILAAPARLLAGYLERLGTDNVQGELYLTDVIALAVADGVPVAGVPAGSAEEVAGINDRSQLAAAERYFQEREAGRLMAEGVSLADPKRLDVRGKVVAGRDATIDVGVVLEGQVILGEDVYIGPYAVIKDAVLGDGVVIHAHTVIDGAVIAAGCELGPFARLRPGTELSERVKIGNFVETKKTRLGPGTKSNHFAYLGDTTTGAACNIGAGTIVCNYDGKAKHPTELGDNVFIGSNATLVAPLSVGTDGYVAAGSTVTSTVADGDLAVGRARQRNIQGWTPPTKREPSEK